MRRQRIRDCLYYGCGLGNLEWSASHPYLHRGKRMSKRKKLGDMTIEELKKELEFAKECLRDAEELYSFTFGKACVHIGGQRAVALQEEHEEKCREYRERIRQIEELLRGKHVQ